MTLVWRPGYGGAAVSDPDAMAYLRAVEEADNQALEQGVQQAVNQFVIGCKQDGIWDAIKASCILAGARTTNGALVPLKGTAPTPYNFDLVGDADYDRKTGLVGDGSTKYLNSNRNNNVDPQDNFHMAAWVSTHPTLGTAVIGCGAGDTGATHIVASVNTAQTRSRSSSSSAPSAFTTGTVGMSRSSGSVYTENRGSSLNTVAITSQSPYPFNIYVFARNVNNSTNSVVNARLAFYSIGEALDLALLDARVTDLMTAIGAAIP